MNQPASENMHHGIPRSSGGSDADVNLTKMPEKRHDRFHAWSINRRPCLNTRLIALHSIGLEKYSLHPDTIETIFQITTMRNWFKLYYSAAFKNITSVCAVAAAQEIADALRIHLTEEKLFLKQTMNAIEGRGPFPVKGTLLLPRCLSFFNTDSPREALEQMYTEGSSPQHLAWVKPMLRNTRNLIVETLGKDKTLKPIPNPEHRLREILHEQLAHITRHEEEWNGHSKRAEHLTKNEDEDNDHQKRQTKRRRRR